MLTGVACLVGKLLLVVRLLIYTPYTCGDFIVYNICITIKPTLYTLSNVSNHISMLSYKFISIIYEEGVFIHWRIRRRYQKFLYWFNMYHERHIYKKHIRRLYTRYIPRYLLLYTYVLYNYNLFTRILILVNLFLEYWYLIFWFYWVCLTLYLYHNSEVRDLGPSFDIYDYNPEDNMGIYLTIGPFMLLSWFCWTWSADTGSIWALNFLLHKTFFNLFRPFYRYYNTIHSYIEMSANNFIYSFVTTNTFIVVNYFILWNITFIDITQNIFDSFINFSTKLFESDVKASMIWFPWESFFNYITVLSIFYMLTLISIYNTENTYYVVLYFTFLVFLFSSTLVLLDLDIFAGLLVLIESVVVLMLFFLIIYLTPNIASLSKVNSWKVWTALFILFVIISSFSYFNLPATAHNNFLNTSIVLDDFYEALHESFISELTGVYVSLYWTNSLLLLIIGVLLLIASIICVVLVSFFTKLRAFNYKTFFDLFNIAKTCYSFIFLRKQNLSKQGRSVSSTRVFSKKTFDKNMHAEYKEKQDAYEQKNKKNEI